MRAPCLLFLACGCLGAGAHGATQDETAARYLTAEIAPAKTSIYIGTIKLTVLPMTRHGSSYSSTYYAKVFPYFFYDETGQFGIDVSDADLVRLANGQPIDIIGVARRSDGVERPVRGRAMPSSPTDGQVKVRVFISPRLILVFNTTYHLSERQN